MHRRLVLMMGSVGTVAAAALMALLLAGGHRFIAGVPGPEETLLPTLLVGATLAITFAAVAALGWSAVEFALQLLRQRGPRA